MKAASVARAPERRYVVATTIFLRLVGLSFVFAFGSLATQVRGLVGEHGIEPANRMLAALARVGGLRGVLLAPTIFHGHVSDGALVATCIVGAVAGALIVIGVFQAPMLIVCWALYLSLCSIGGDFLSFQWDALLIETSFLAIFLAPWTWRPWDWRFRSPPALPLWLLRILLFRLMVASGACKLVSDDATWRSLRALEVHYQTQPLPTWIGYYAHQLPVSFQHFSCAMVFVVELGVPVLLFLPRPFRRVAAFTLIGFQILIDLTGNYTFFGVLTTALCFLFLDDAVFPRRLSDRVGEPKTRPRWLLYVGLPFAAVWLVISGVQFARSLTRHLPVESHLAKAVDVAQRFETINHYGLFAVMTTQRREIVIEGSDDGKNWKPYVFHWKPQALDRRPGFVEPMQPRLDWQMWFAALGPCERSNWFVPLVEKLLVGDEAVTNLFETNPFPNHPPKLIRTTLYEYRFTDLGTKARSGAWWEREALAPFCPTLSAESVRVRHRGEAP